MNAEIFRTIEVLKKGGTILYPTDTIWGLGCDATNFNAVEKIKQIKKRPDEKKFIVLIDTKEKISQYVKELPKIAYEIAFALIDSNNKPLTIVYPRAYGLAKNVIADDGSIAIRVVKHEFCCELINQLGKPLVSSSANISGAIAPSSFDAISNDIINLVDYSVQLYRNSINQFNASTLIKIDDSGSFVVLRD